MTPASVQLVLADPSGPPASGIHVAIIMDGNGRWAERQGLPRAAGHAQGATAVGRILETAAASGIGTLTLYAFSSDNWGRPAEEVDALMDLMRRYLGRQAKRCLKHSIKLNVIGRRDRIPENLLWTIEEAEEVTSSCEGMLLRIAVDYSSRHSLLEAAQARYQGPEEYASRSFEDVLASVTHSVSTEDKVDLLIRTGGEKRLSDFLLWECAYAELHFIDVLWPNFNGEHLQAALAEYAKRQRRFGRLPKFSAG